MQVALARPVAGIRNDALGLTKSCAAKSVGSSDRCCSAEPTGAIADVLEA